MPMRSSRSTIARAGMVALAAFALTGCAANTLETYDLVNEPGPAVDLRFDPTPEVYTLHQRPSDWRNEFGVMWDENVRMIRQDFHRAFYWDRPSRLTREPVPR